MNRKRRVFRALSFGNPGTGCCTNAEASPRATAAYLHSEPQQRRLDARGEPAEGAWRGCLRCLRMDQERLRRERAGDGGRGRAEVRRAGNAHVERAPAPSEVCPTPEQRGPGRRHVPAQSAEGAQMEAHAECLSSAVALHDPRCRSSPPRPLPRGRPCTAASRPPPEGAARLQQAPVR